MAKSTLLTKKQRKRAKLIQRALLKSDAPGLYGPVVEGLRLLREQLEPYVASDSRVAALDRDLASKVQSWEQIAPTDGLAEQLGELTQKTAGIPSTDLETRAALSKAATPGQLAYLRSVSPRAAEAFESGRNAA